MRRIVVLNKLAARPEPLKALVHNIVCQFFRQQSERNGGNDIVHRFYFSFRKKRPHIFSRLREDANTGVQYGLFKFFYKNRVDLKHIQVRFGLHPVQQKVRDRPIAGAQFHHHPGVFRMDRFGHSLAQKTGAARHTAGKTEVAKTFFEEINM